MRKRACYSQQYHWAATPPQPGTDSEMQAVPLTCFNWRLCMNTMECLSSGTPAYLTLAAGPPPSHRRSVAVATLLRRPGLRLKAARCIE